MVEHGDVAGAVELGSKGHTIIGRAVIAAAHDVVPLIVERLERGLGTVGIAKEVPVVPVAHTAGSKLEVAADKLGAFVVFLSADADMSVGRYLEFLEGGHNRQGRHVDTNLYGRYTAEDSTLRDGGEVGSTASVL